MTLRDRFLREADNGLLGGGWTGRLRVGLFVVGILAALMFGAASDRGYALIKLLFLAVVTAAGSLWVWANHRRAVAERRRRKPPLGLSA